MGDSTGLGGRAARRLDSFFLFLEKRRLSILALFVYLLIISVARDLSEIFLLDREFVISGAPWIYSISHHVAFYFVVFLGLVLLLTAFSGERWDKCTKYLASIYWLILLPPWLDYYFFGARTNYSYFSPTDFLNYLLHFSGEQTNPGQAIEVILILGLMLAFVLWKRRDEIGTVRGRLFLLSRAGLMLGFAVVAMFFMSTPGAYLPVGSEGGVSVFPNFAATRYVQLHLFIYAYYLLLGVVLLFALGSLAMKGRFLSMVKRTRPAQSFFFLSIATAGIAYGWATAGGAEYVFSILERPYWINLSSLIMALTAAYLTWQVSALWNDVSDRKSDSPQRDDRVLASGLFCSRDFMEGSVVLSAVAVFTAYLLSPISAVVLLAILVLSYIYSFPPFRLKNHLLSSVLVGLGAALVLMYGATAPFNEIVVRPVVGPLPTGVMIQPELTPFALLLSFFAIIGLVVGSMITDVDGFEEDRAGKVKTIYTVLGFQRGVVAVSGLVFVSALTTLCLFNDLEDVLIFTILGATAAYGFYRTKRSRTVLAIAVLGMIYGAFRFVQLFVAL